MKDGVPLKKLGKAMYFLGDLIKLTKPNLWFIDNNGQVFNYLRHRTVPLIFTKIKKTIKIPSGGAILELEGIPSRFKTMYSPLPGEEYAGVIQDGMSYILYGVYKELHKNTKRKI